MILSARVLVGKMLPKHPWHAPCHVCDGEVADVCGRAILSFQGLKLEHVQDHGLLAQISFSDQAPWFRFGCIVGF